MSRDDFVQVSKQPKLKISNLNPYLNEIEVPAHSHRNAKSSALISSAPKRPCTTAPLSPSESRKKVSLLFRGSCLSGDGKLYPKKYRTSPPFNVWNRQEISREGHSQSIGTTIYNFRRRSRARPANLPPTIFLMSCIQRYATGSSPRKRRSSRNSYDGASSRHSTIGPGRSRLEISTCTR